MLELLSFEIVGPEVWEIWKYSDVGPDLTGPVWDETSGVRRPTCASRSSSTLRLTTKVRLSPAGLQPGQQLSFDIEAAASSPPMIFRGNVTGVPGDEPTVSLDLTFGQLDDQVKKQMLTLQWSFRPLDSSQWTLLATTGPLVMFQTYGQPLTFPYDFGLELACGYVNAASDPALAICEGIAGELGYNPDKTDKGHVLGVYESEGGDCNDHAEVMKHLCVSIGLDAQILNVWGGTAATRVKYRYRELTGAKRASIQLQAPSVDAAEEDPHFLEHVVVRIGPRVLDACYGTEGLTVLETALGYSEQSSTDGFGATLTCDWPCPHSTKLPNDPTDCNPIVDELIARPDHELLRNDRRIAEVDVRAVMEAVDPDAVYVRHRPTSEGFAHHLERDRRKACEITVGIRADAKSSHLAWAEQVESAEGSPTDTDIQIGEALALWPPRSSRFSGNLVFRRLNAVVGLSGRARLEALLQIGHRIDRAIQEAAAGIVPGAPALPRLTPQIPVAEGRFDTARWEESKLLVTRQASSELRIPISVEYEKEDKITLFTRDVTIGRILNTSAEPGWAYIFLPFRPGRYECTIVGLARTSVVATETFWIEVAGAS